MRYMWSAIDSPWTMPKRRQPSRLVVLRRWRRCRKGRGDEEFVWGRWERVERAVSGLQLRCWEAVFAVRTPDFEVGGALVSGASETILLILKWVEMGVLQFKSGLFTLRVGFGGRVGSFRVLYHRRGKINCCFEVCCFSSVRAILLSPQPNRERKTSKRSILRPLHATMNNVELSSSPISRSIVCHEPPSP